MTALPHRLMLSVTSDFYESPRMDEYIARSVARLRTQIPELRGEPRIELRGRDVVGVRHARNWIQRHVRWLRSAPKPVTICRLDLIWD
jgi:hypothetical protein